MQLCSICVKFNMHNISNTSLNRPCQHKMPMFMHNMPSCKHNISLWMHNMTCICSMQTCTNNMPTCMYNMNMPSCMHNILICMHKMATWLMHTQHANMHPQYTNMRYACATCRYACIICMYEVHAHYSHLAQPKDKSSWMSLQGDFPTHRSQGLCAETDWEKFSLTSQTHFRKKGKGLVNCVYKLCPTGMQLAGCRNQISQS